MTRSRAKTVPPVFLSALLLAAGPATAQPPAEPAPGPSSTPPTASSPSTEGFSPTGAPDPEWTVRIEPSFWYVAPSGKVKLPASSGSGSAASPPGDRVKIEQLNLDSPRFEPTGEVHFSGGPNGRLRFTFSGATYSIERDDTQADSSFRLGSVSVSSGDTLETSFDFTTVELTGGYRIWGRNFSDAAHTEKPENAVPTIARLYLIGGARFYNTSFELARRSGAPGSAEADQFFGEPIVGARAEIDIARDFTLDLQVSGGGLPLSDSSSYSVDIQAGFQWRPHPNIGIQIGYRQLAFWLSDGEDADEFEYNGRLAGLFAGLEIQF